MRLPLPETGGFPGVAGSEVPPVNTTLLSATCSFAAGVAVPIPTLPVPVMSASPDSDEKYPPVPNVDVPLTPVPASPDSPRTPTVLLPVEAIPLTPMPLGALVDPEMPTRVAPCTLSFAYVDDGVPNPICTMPLFVLWISSPLVVHRELPLPVIGSCQVALPTESLVSTLPEPGVPPVSLSVPFSSSFAVGVDVPMPTLPEPVMRAYPLSEEK